MVSFGALARKVFGSANDRRVKATKPRLQAINALENEIRALSDAELTARTQKFREELANGKTLDDLLVPAFATVREAARRVLGLRPFDVQLVGGMVLHDGGIAEMRTGEGKTLVATAPVYLNALAEKGVHVVTVNDYLAKRDAEWMGRIYKFLGLTVGIIVHGIDDEERRDAYNCDVTYATNNELGFDYLRDNMKYERAQMVQRPHNYAIVDEVDSILIDEARTPLIISGPTDDKSELYISVDAIVKQLVPEDYDMDEKQRTIVLTEDGTAFLERATRITREVEDAAVDMAERRGTLAGPLRISAPVTFGRMHLGPAIYPFLARHTEIALTLDLDDRRVDIVREGFDLAIRGSDKLEDSSLIARKLAVMPHVLCAAPSYFQKHGVPETPSDLKALDHIRFGLSSHADAWEFSKDGRMERIAVAARYSVTSSLAVRDALRTGFGVSLIPRPYVENDLRNGRLQPALEDWSTVETTLYAVYASRQYIAPKIRVFLDFLIEAFK